METSERVGGGTRVEGEEILQVIFVFLPENNEEERDEKFKWNLT